MADGQPLLEFEMTGLANVQMRLSKDFLYPRPMRGLLGGIAGYMVRRVKQISPVDTTTMMQSFRMQLDRNRIPTWAKVASNPGGSPVTYAYPLEMSHKSPRVAGKRIPFWRPSEIATHSHAPNLIKAAELQMQGRFNK